MAESLIDKVRELVNKTKSVNANEAAGAEADLVMDHLLPMAQAFIAVDDVLKNLYYDGSQSFNDGVNSAADEIRKAIESKEHPAG